ncbi:MAG: DNA photolyase [Gammaproteobacteria bacterium]|nr:DNA photolyase [Gammaproteobacteria bacterium]
MKYKGYIEKGQQDSAIAKHFLQVSDNVAEVDAAPNLSDYRDGKKIIAITEKKGNAFSRCASHSDQYICCNVYVLPSVSNCPYDCSYCFLQNYLTDTTTSVVADTAALLADVKKRAAEEPWRFFRFGTWELGDSLAIEPQTHASADLVRAVQPMKNCLLELKTKSAHVDSLLGLDHGQRVVIAWSLNPQAVITAEELKTASLQARLEAIKKVTDDGYLVAIHFDPMILHEGWQAGYESLIEQLFQMVSPKQVAWISIGSLRFNPEMKKSMEHNFPKSRMTSAEMVLGDDGKMRYIKPLRSAMYQHVYQLIRRYGGDEPYVYLCMERWDMWKKVFGTSPDSAEHLDFLMTESLYRRFPDLVHQAPERELYESSKV